MARAAIAPKRLDSLCKLLRSHGVVEFSDGSVTLKLTPTAPQPLLVERKRQARIDLEAARLKDETARDLDVTPIDLDEVASRLI